VSLYTLAFMGVTPFGSLLYGWLANRIGAPRAIALGGAVCVASALLFALRLPLLRAEVRPIYARLGIIPEVATGLQSASDLMVPPEKQ
jgi:hypothetical protein